MIFLQVLGKKLRFEHRLPGRTNLAPQIQIWPSPPEWTEPYLHG